MSDPLIAALEETTPPAPRGSVKRRPRRKRRANWGIRFAVGLGVLLVGAFVAYFCFSLWLKSYLRSPGFQNQLSDQLSATIKAQSEFEGLGWTGNQVQLQKMLSTGYADAAFSKLVVDDVRADLKMDLWNRTVDVPSINASRLQITVSPEGKLPRLFPETSSVESSAPPKTGWLDSLMPKTFTLGEIKIEDTSLTVKSADAELRLAGLPLTLKSSPDLQTWSLNSHPQGDRAQLVTNLAKGMKLQVLDLNARLRPEQFDLLSFEGDLTPLAKPNGKREGSFSKARINLTGSSQTTAPAPEIDFHLTASELDLQDWVEETWVKRLSGKADLTARLTGSFANSSSLKLTGDFAMKRGVLTSLPFLENLAERTRTKEFTRLELNTAKCSFIQHGDTWQFHKIEVEARGLVRLEGTITITGQNVSGVLEVGVSPGRLHAIDGAEQRVFVRDDRGYKWASPPMRLSGTIDNLQEDLATRIKDAWFDQQIENVTDLATKTPEAMLKGGTEVINQGVKAAPEILHQGFDLFNSLLPKSP